jgi:hypothetical protein
MFPKEEIKAFIAALKANDVVGMVKSGWVIGKWLIDTLSELGILGKGAADGVLAVSEPLGDDAAVAHLASFTGDNPAAIDPAILKPLLSWLLGKILERLAK